MCATEDFRGRNLCNMEGPSPKFILRAKCGQSLKTEYQPVDLLMLLPPTLVQKLSQGSCVAPPLYSLLYILYIPELVQCTSSGINNFGSGSGQPLLRMNLKQNFFDQKDNRLDYCVG